MYLDVVSKSDVERDLKKAKKAKESIPYGDFKTVKSFAGDNGYCNTWANELSYSAAKGTDEGASLAKDLINSASNISKLYSDSQKAVNSLKGITIDVKYGDLETDSRLIN